MHAVKTPFTGFFVGGFAVVCIGLIAFYSGKNFRIIIQSTVLVILVKAAVSPHSPITAHFAVLFQGVAGALFYSLISNFSVASVIFGFIALLESAVQKIIILTLIFGKSLWEALDSFVSGVIKNFSVPADFSFSNWVVVFYVALYSIWGIILGFWISKLPRRIELRSKKILRSFRSTKMESDMLLPGNKGKRKKIFILFLVLLFIVSVFMLGGSDSNKVLFVVLRTLAAIALLFYLVQPVLKWLLNKWLVRKAEQHKAKLQNILDALPEMKNLVRPAFALASQNKSGLKKYSEFVFILIVLSLQPETRE